MWHRLLRCGIKYQRNTRRIVEYEFPIWNKGGLRLLEWEGGGYGSDSKAAENGPE